MTTATYGSLDWFTAIMVLIIAVIVCFGSAAVTRFYARVLRAAPSHSGLLLWHIVAISVAVSGTWAMLALSQMQILGWFTTPRELRLIGYALFGLLTVTALALIGMMQKRRVRGGSTEVIVEERRSTHIDES